MIMNLSKVLGQRAWGLLAGLGLIGLLFGGCQSAPPEKFANNIPGLPPVGPSTTVSTTASTTPSTTLDTLFVGQQVLITFSDMPTPVAPFTDVIKQDGTLTLPFQNKTFVAAGKNRRQFEQEVHDFYVPAYYRQMTISIQGAPQTRFYYVGGEVKQPGRQVYIGPITVLGAIASAGDFTDFSSKGSVKLVHPDGHIQVINCKKALKDPSLDLPVYPEDKVIVPRRWL